MTKRIRVSPQRRGPGGALIYVRRSAKLREHLTWGLTLCALKTFANTYTSNPLNRFGFTCQTARRSMWIILKCVW